MTGGHIAAGAILRYLNEEKRQNTQADPPPRGPERHGEAFIVQPTGNIVLVNADEKTVKLSDSLLSLHQPLLMQPQ